MPEVLEVEAARRVIAEGVPLHREVVAVVAPDAWYLKTRPRRRRARCGLAGPASSSRLDGEGS